jgi:hypothetical protein
MEDFVLGCKTGRFRIEDDNRLDSALLTGARGLMRLLSLSEPEGRNPMSNVMIGPGAYGFKSGDSANRSFTLGPKVFP